MIHAVIVVGRLTPAMSASGDNSGIASAAWPELYGMTNAIGMFTSTAATAKASPRRW